MQIKVTIKNVYGRETIYPACELAQKFADLVGTKTLTRDALKHIRGLGYDIQVQAPTLGV